MPSPRELTDQQKLTIAIDALRVCAGPIKLINVDICFTISSPLARRAIAQRRTDAKKALIEMGELSDV